LKKLAALSSFSQIPARMFLVCFPSGGLTLAMLSQKVFTTLQQGYNVAPDPPVPCTF